MEVEFNPELTISRILRAVAADLEEFGAEFDPQVRPADPRFGDFQANGVLPWAKARGANPRALAQRLLDAAAGTALGDPARMSMELAGPGFLNFKLSPGYLRDWLVKFGSEQDLRGGAGEVFHGSTVVIDYPSPNTAKQMHVGHLRPMVIGGALHRMIAFCGAHTISDNHIGDWGTNFGTLIMAIKREGFDLNAPCADPLVEIERLYTEGSRLEKESPELRDISRNELVKLQQGDPENLAIWQRIIDISNTAFGKIYARMGIQLDLTLGESFYRDKVEAIYRELEETGLAQESEGALVVFHPEHKRYATQPFIVRKKDGASNYASTDLATILHRSDVLKADEVVYVTDGRQCDHFEQLFLTAEKWYGARGWKLPKLRHVWFGTILGDNRKALKTRDGGTVKLSALLDEAVERAYAVVREKNPELDEAESRRVAEVVGIGAIKYFDLLQNRTSDYVFSWDKMLTFEGNTAPYLLYAVARIHSIFRKAELDPRASLDATAALDFTDCAAEELALAHKLVAFSGALEQALSDLRPHFLCNYLYELSGVFSSFYNANKVIVDEPAVRARRLLLCARTLVILETGLHLLGLETLERM